MGNNKVCWSRGSSEKLKIGVEEAALFLALPETGFHFVCSAMAMPRRQSYGCPIVLYCHFMMTEKLGERKSVYQKD
jgi:hypothetical protein